MKILKNLIKKLAIGLASYAVIAGLMKPIMDKRVDKYVNSNLARIVLEQEEEMGIKHFGLPEFNSDMGSFYDPNPIFFGGSYNSQNEKIYLGWLFKRTPENSFCDQLENILCFGQLPECEEIIKHELGHFYMDKLNKSKIKGKWPDLYIRGNYPGEPNFKHNIRTQLINEGIARYFQYGENGEDNFKDQNWPCNESGFSDKEIIYSGGYHLVKPIISKHGSKGILYLMKNLPSEKELFNLPEYQKRILLELDAMSSK